MLLILGLTAAVVVVAGAGAVGLGVAVAGRNRAAKSPAALPPGGLDVMSLRVNDVVVHLDATWMVVGRLRYDHTGQTILMYRMEGDGGAVAYLRARFEDRPLVELVEQVEARAAQGTPAQSVLWEEATFQLRSWGQVRVDHAGQTGREGARAEFHLYAAPGERVLLKERWGEEEVTMVGRSLRPEHLELLPGDHVRGA